MVKLPQESDKYVCPKFGIKNSNFSIMPSEWLLLTRLEQIISNNSGDSNISLAWAKPSFFTTKISGSLERSSRDIYTKKKSID